MLALPYYEEVWKDIEDYESLYQVSNFIKVMNVKTGKILKLCLDKSTGYYIVTLYKGNKRKKMLMHRLVAQTFILNPDNLPTVDHINRIKTDNRVDNLRWAPWELQAENRDDTNRESQKESCSKPVSQYTLGGVFIKEYPSIIEAGRDTGINYSSICQCCLGKRKSAGGYIWRYATESPLQ